MAAEFCGLDSNDKWVSSCGSICCTNNHNIRLNSALLYPNDKDMNYTEFQNAFECYLEERTENCNFGKNCFDCRRFKLLCYEYHNKTLLSNRTKFINVTAVRFNSRNLYYKKTQSMTVDILRSHPVGCDFLTQIKEGEENLLQVVNELRKTKVW